MNWERAIEIAEIIQECYFAWTGRDIGKSPRVTEFDALTLRELIEVKRRLLAEFPERAIAEMFAAKGVVRGIIGVCQIGTVDTVATCHFDNSAEMR